MSYRKSMFSFMTIAFVLNDGEGSVKNKNDQTHKDKKWNQYKSHKIIKRARNQQRSNRHTYTNKDMRM